jgi:hypothetical protein
MAGTIRKRRTRRAWQALLFGLLFFILGQIGFRILAHHHPESCELEYGQNLVRLRARLAEKPGHPLALMLGNSRAGRGFRPSALPPLPGDPVVFDFAQSGSGPIHNRLWLHRLLAQGIRPTHVIVETWPPFWHLYKTGEDVLQLANLGILTHGDVGVLSAYAAAPQRLCRHWVEHQLAPMFPNRGPLLRSYLPLWLPPATYTIAGLELLDNDGWRPASWAYDRGWYLKMTEEYRQTFAFMKDFQIPPQAAAALRDTLAACRANGIRPMLLMMPESSAFRGWYTPAARVACDAFLQELSRTYDAPLIDARTWMPDEQFVDPAHLVAPGATAFTQRFGREVLVPFLKNEPLPHAPCIPPSPETVAQHD